MEQDESHNVEYKRSWHDEYLRWVCGFANAKGGTLWIGIDDDKSIVGVSGAKKLMEDIPNKIKDLLGIVVDVSHNPKSLSPRFYSAVGCFVVTLPNLNGSQESSMKENGVNEKVNERQRKIIAIVADNPYITQSDLVSKLGISLVHVNKNMKKLQGLGIIRRVGPDKGGHWEVIS